MHTAKDREPLSACASLDLLSAMKHKPNLLVEAARISLPKICTADEAYK